MTVTATCVAASVLAGGSGLNVVVVVNQNSTNSVQLGNDYCERRNVPPQNLFRMTGWSGSPITWSRTDFETRLLNPLLTMLSARGLTNQAEYVLLSMDIPYRIEDNGSQNSTTSALFYGFKQDTTPPPGAPASCSLPDSSSNSYAFSESPFRAAPPDTAVTNSFLAMMLTDNSLPAAELILDRGVAADSSFPVQAVYLAKTSDVDRNVRHLEFDNAIFDDRVAGCNSLIRIDTDSTSFTNLLGLLTGLANLSLPPGAFVPGAMGDSLTSYAGFLFEFSGQTPLLAFLDAGASGSYGTVVEPCNYTQKFPNPLDYFYQERGYSLAEAYYQSLQNPYQGLLVGEPLSAPFARRGSADWSSLTNGTVRSGQTTLNLTFFSAATNLPLSQADLFIDGSFLRTITNLPPSAGNVLSLILNGHTVNYTVPANATIVSTAAGLASALNAQTNSTRVKTFPIGDRLELQSLDVAVPGANVTLSAGTTIGSAAQLTTQLTPMRPTSLDTTATGYLGVLVSNTPVIGDWLQFDFIKTNGVNVTIAVTNTTGTATIATLAQNLVNLVNSNPALQSADGLFASDFVNYEPSGLPAAQFIVYARSPGWLSAQIRATLTASANLVVLPAGINRLEDNLTDLRPRNHLYVRSGAISLPVSFAFDSVQLPDGFHELGVVAYEGTSVRTQTRVSRSVRIQNTPLSAAFTALPAGTNVTLGTLLQFIVNAGGGNISSIELFGTGGSLGVVSNQPNASFPVTSASLGPGLHPFYALVTDAVGNRYQTETKWIRIIPPLALNITKPPLTLSWPAIPGYQYDILATANLAGGFQTIASVTASNRLIEWPIPAPAGSAGFYRVRLAP